MIVKLPDTSWVFGVRFLIEEGIFIFALTQTAPGNLSVLYPRILRTVSPGSDAT
jgi:hypothetical protein